MANFAWWNEDHNYYIDLRARSRPPGRSPWAEASAPTATTTPLFLFLPELRQVCDGDRQWTDLQSIVTARHEYYDHYQDKRRRSRR